MRVSGGSTAWIVHLVKMGVLGRRQVDEAYSRLIFPCRCQNSKIFCVVIAIYTLPTIKQAFSADGKSINSNTLYNLIISINSNDLYNLIPALASFLSVTKTRSSGEFCMKNH